MKRKLILLLAIFLLILPVSMYPGSFHFGVISALRDKVEEIQEEKEKDKLPRPEIIAPADGSTVSGTINVLVEVNMLVPKVEFYIDGILRTIDSVVNFP